MMKSGLMKLMVALVMVAGLPGMVKANANCNIVNASASPGCPVCPQQQSGANVGCALVLIMAGPLRPESSIQSALFRFGEETMSEATYAPGSLTFVAGYAMKGISHDVTLAGAPRQVIIVGPSGVPNAFNFTDGNAIGVPVVDSGWAQRHRVYMVDANGWSVLKDPAYYDLYTKEGELFRFVAAKRSPQYMNLVLHRLVSGREETPHDMGVDVVRDDASGFRQVLLPSRLADIVVPGDEAYSVNFYLPSALTGAKDTNGCYLLKAGAVPFESWAFTNPVPGKLTKLRVTNTVGSKSKVYDFTHIAENGDWLLATGDGATVSRKTSREVNWNDARTERLETVTVQDTSGKVTSRVQDRIVSLGYGLGEGVTENIQDPLGAALTNRYSYNAAGLTETAVKPDGNWNYFTYDSARRVLQTLGPVGDMAVVSNANLARAIVNDYTPVDGLDSPRLSDQQPRTVTESVLGTVVARTYHAFRTLANKEYQEIEEKAFAGTAAYGDVRNSGKVTTYYGTNSANTQIGRLKSVQYPDGRVDVHSYDYGNYQPANGSEAPTFTADAAGEYWRETVTHGAVSNVNGVVGGSTREVTVKDGMGEVVLQEQWVCLGEALWARAGWVMKQFDDWQHPVVVLKSNGERTEASWGQNCCGKEWETGADGTEYAFEYDLFGRPVTQIKRGTTTNEADIMTLNTYDVSSRKLTERKLAGGLSLLVSSNVFDLAGRLTHSVDGLGIATQYRYAGAINTSIRGGVTNVTAHYADGKPKYSVENGMLKSWHEYGVNADGTQWSKTYSGSLGSNSPAWTKTTADQLGRTVLEEKPGFGGTILTNAYLYNAKGQLARTTSNQQPSTLSEYNELAQQTRSGLDVNGNGTLDLAGPDRVTESATWYEEDATGAIWNGR